MTLLTVLLPTLGERLTLPVAMASVEAQTVPCELLVEYDTDGIGAGPMLNRMLPMVATPWVSTFADDDFLDPRFAEWLEAEQDADLVIFQMRYEEGLTLPQVTRPEDLRFGHVGCSYAVRTEVARRVGGWIDVPCTPSLAEDWEMIRSVRDSGGVIRIVPRVAYYVRHQP